MMCDHSEKACRMFAEGKNCAQAVFAAFSDVTGMDEETALRLSSSFGGGMGKMREVCGACSAMFMVAGMLYGYSYTEDNAEKSAHYKRIQQLAEEFRHEHDSIICRELLQGLKVTKGTAPEERTEKYYKARPCIRFVRTASEILDRYIAENQVN